MNYYRRYVGDYLRDTSRLSMLEHGAYNLLLDYYYAEERPIPSDLTEVYRMVRAILPEERAAVDRVLSWFFKKNDKLGYKHKRVEHEIGVSKQARSNGKNGGRPKTGEVTGCETGTVTIHETGDVGGSGHPPTNQPTNLQPPADQPPLILTPATAGEAKPAVPPPCPHVEIVKIYSANLPMGRQVRPPWNGARATHLQARWREDKARQCLQWWEEFFAYCAGSAFLTGKKPSRKPGDKPFSVSLDWIVEPANFQKIIEGAYDD